LPSAVTVGIGRVQINRTDKMREVHLTKASTFAATGVGGGSRHDWRIASKPGPASLARSAMRCSNSPSKSPRNSRVFLAQNREARVVVTRRSYPLLGIDLASSVAAAPPSSFPSEGDFKGKPRVKWFWLIWTILRLYWIIAAVKHLVQNWAGDFVMKNIRACRIAAEKFYGFVLLVSRRLASFGPLIHRRLPSDTC